MIGIRSVVAATASAGLLYYLLGLGGGGGGSDSVDRSGDDGGDGGSGGTPRGGGGGERKSRPTQAETVVVRAAFDVGSGATKIAVGRCTQIPGDGNDGNGKNGRFASYAVRLPLLHQDYREVLLRHSLTHDGLLAEATLEKCFRVLSGYVKACRAHGCRPHDMFGIATAVFREARNGQAFLDKVACELGVEIRIVSQALEGRIGYRTALNAARGSSARHEARSPAKRRGPRRVIAWDLGGGSFQITDGRGNMYGGQVGSSTALQLMVEHVQGRAFTGRGDSSCNPCSMDECRGLRDHLRAHCMPPVADWLVRATEGGAAAGHRVVSIGGSTCAFRMAELATGEAVFGAREIWAAIEHLVGHDDASLAVLGFPQPGMLLPKLVLIYTVMQWATLHEIEYVATTGSTLGLLATSVAELEEDAAVCEPKRMVPPVL
jgi:hypothetical protein